MNPVLSPGFNKVWSTSGESLNVITATETYSVDLQNTDRLKRWWSPFSAIHKVWSTSKEGHRSHSGMCPLWRPISSTFRTHIFHHDTSLHQYLTLFKHNLNEFMCGLETVEETWIHWRKEATMEFGCYDRYGGLLCRPLENIFFTVRLVNINLWRCVSVIQRSSYFALRPLT